MKIPYLKISLDGFVKHICFVMFETESCFILMNQNDDQKKTSPASAAANLDPRATWTRSSSSLFFAPRPNLPWRNLPKKTPMVDLQLRLLHLDLQFGVWNGASCCAPTLGHNGWLILAIFQGSKKSNVFESYPDIQPVSGKASQFPIFNRWRG